MSKNIIPQAGRGFQFIPFLSAVCDHCGHDLQILRSPDADTRKLIACYSLGCVCRLDTATLAGLLGEEAQALTAFHALRREMYTALEMVAADSLATMVDDPLPPGLRSAVSAVYQHRLRAEAQEVAA